MIAGKKKNLIKFIMKGETFDFKILKVQWYTYSHTCTHIPTHIQSHTYNHTHK